MLRFAFLALALALPPVSGGAALGPAPEPAPVILSLTDDRAAAPPALLAAPCLDAPGCGRGRAPAPPAIVPLPAAPASIPFAEIPLPGALAALGLALSMLGLMLRRG